MTTSIYRILRTLDTRSRRQRDKGRTNMDGDQRPADVSAADHKMKIQTDLKAGGGLMDIDLDIDLDLNVNLFSSGNKKVSSGRERKKG